MTSLKVGVVGVGHLGREHARIYAAMKGAELVGVVDADEAGEMVRDLAYGLARRAYNL